MVQVESLPQQPVAHASNNSIRNGKKIEKTKSNTMIVIYPWPPHSKFLTECSHPFVRILQCFTHRWHTLAGTQLKLNPKQE